MDQRPIAAIKPAAIDEWGSNVVITAP